MPLKSGNALRILLVLASATVFDGCRDSTTAPTPVERTLEGTAPLGPLTLTVVHFNVDGAGVVSSNVDWTSASNDIDTGIVRGRCTVDQILRGAAGCTQGSAIDSDATAQKPSELSASLETGEHTLIIINFGPGADTVTYRIDGNVSDASISGGGSTPLTGSVPDLTGDAMLVAGVPVPPDLAAARIDISAGSLTINVTYTPGTMSQTRTMFSAFLDIDENPATGNAGVPAAAGTVDDNLIGWDYVINAVDPADLPRASVQRALGGGRTEAVDTLSATFPAANQIRVVVPMALLGHDDGRMSFKVVSRQWATPQPPPSDVLDYTPEPGLQPGLVR
jgi:hypothetical protein